MVIASTLLIAAMLAYGAEPSDSDEVPSALDGLLSSDEPGRRVTHFNSEESKGTGAWFVWPIGATSYYPGPPQERTYQSNFLGLSVGRRWYAIGGKIRYSVESAVSGEFPLGPRTHGRMLRAYILGGPRSRYLSVVAGPVVAHNALRLDRAAHLAPALFVGAQAMVLTDLGVITLYAGLEPLWQARGDRPAADYDALWLPGFGDEFSYLGGASIAVGAHWRVLLGDRIWLSSIGAYHHPTVGFSIQ